MPASASVVITGNPGGNIDQFVEHYELIRASGDDVVIDGPCMSACTLLTGIVPSERVCVTPRAVLGFHSAFFADPRTGKNLGFSELGTRKIWLTYPPKVRELLKQHGWDGTTAHTKIIPIQGDELHELYAPCKAS